jgi:hypothetical protein
LKEWREELQNLLPISLPSIQITSHENGRHVTSPAKVSTVELCPMLAST